MRRSDPSFRGVLPGVCVRVYVCVCLLVCDLETATTRRPEAKLGC